MDHSAVEQLRARVRGSVLCPGHEGYDEARKIPNAMIDRRPALIVRSTGAADVVSSVCFAREQPGGSRARRWSQRRREVRVRRRIDD